ncbi:MAG: bifunctional diguanylate cyclase/phosphodiesterase [Cyanobacteria bacterium J06623_4]
MSMPPTANLLANTFPVPSAPKKSAPTVFSAFISTTRSEESTSVQLHAPELWQVNALSLGSPTVGVGLAMGSLSLLMACLWIRVRRLSVLIRRRDQRIKTLLSVDSLTGLANRKTFFQSGEKLLAADPDARIAVLLLNLDQFKAINDEVGTAVGDSLLKQVASRLSQCIGPDDIVARVGGDEFALLLRTASCSQVEVVAERVLSAIAQPFAIQSQVFSIRGRLGAALSVSNGSKKSYGFSQLCSQARVAVTQLKPASPKLSYLELSRLGLSPQPSGQSTRQALSASWVIFQPEMAREIQALAQRRRSLHLAIERQELQVHYQPIVDLETSQTVGFEALVRWQHPEQGLLYPNDFLPLAEEIGLSVSIDRWVLRQVCQQLISWRESGLSPYVSVNLSGSHLSRPDVVDYVQWLLDRFQVDPTQLNLEVTESVMIDEPEQATNTLRQLRQKGLCVSLDDFGTGYSSLGYLQQFPVDVLKIDRSFVQHLQQPADPDTVIAPCQDKVILQSILSLAEGLGLRVVAEGIERSDQLWQLKQMGCHYGQGNFFSGSVSGQSARELLTVRS